MIYIYTENFFLWPRIKHWLKLLIGKGYRGPQAVESSLLRGLLKLNVEFKVNNKNISASDTACVISGVQTLKWVIAKKKQGKVGKLIAGPTLVVIPSEENGIIISEEVNAFLVPSLWSKDWWSSLEPDFSERIKLWPAGVNRDSSVKNASAQTALILQKNAPWELTEFIKNQLAIKNIPYRLLKYGEFSRKKYLKALSESKFMVYLSQSESQGISLHEAWMANVPTLVWAGGRLKYKNYVWEDAKISAPLMDKICGLFFKDSGDFLQVFENFIANNNSFSPRNYSLQNFTDEISAKKYLNIIESIKIASK